MKKVLAVACIVVLAAMWFAGAYLLDIHMVEEDNYYD